MSKHTPGKWIVEPGGVGEGSFEINSDTSPWGAVAACESNKLGSRLITPEEAEANAHLIASAPDLLAALEELAEAGAESWGESRPCVQAARVAIAKAKGGES